ncbi:lysine exporter LysO family protein [Pantoea sp. A4]|uniref:lysine exporter LysO family protein n=1 Tax=Pantoea sp. A4 TaxID=1225184 RepID=UPI000365A286|nr:lysine exporter LysO family protein [Pantoea sp. A4]
MYTGLLIILLPLIIGWLLPFRHPRLLHVVNRALSYMVYVILFFMGISLAFLDNLSSNLVRVFHTALICAVCILLCNLLALWLWEKRQPWQHNHRQEQLPSRLKMALDSLQLCAVVVLGFLLGLTQWPLLHHATAAGEYALMCLLLLVGIQLRGSGMTLRQIVINRRGMTIAAVVTLSALVGGMIAALILGLPLKTGLALGSGMGWYSISGILMTEGFGPVLGSAAFFNDLIRELVAIILIPPLIQRHRTLALGISGATSMDFTLPVLQRAGGSEIVPAAIVHGFITSLLAPILIALFSG